MFRSYNNVERKWDDVMMSPTWLDIGTACCTYTTGIILAGSAKPKTARNVAILDFNSQNARKLPDLPDPLQGPGLLYHDSVLYVVGGSQCFNAKSMWKASKQVYSLQMTNSFCSWKRLPLLTHAIEWPIVSAVAEYLCVLGGVEKCNSINSTKAKGRSTKYRQIFNTKHCAWQCFNDTPMSCDSRAGGGFVQGNNIVMYLPSSRLTLDLSKSVPWSIHDYKQYKSVGSKLTPVLYNNKIYACITKDRSNTLQTYNPEQLWWSREDINVNHCKNSHYFFVV